MAAGRMARMVAWVTGQLLGDWAVGSGWLGRARSILTETGKDSPESGWVLIWQSFAEPDAVVRETLLRDAISIGRRFGDPDVEFEALGCLGGVFVMTGRVEEGLALIDEALAAACAGELFELGWTLGRGGGPACRVRPAVRPGYAGTARRGAYPFGGSAPAPGAH